MQNFINAAAIGFGVGINAVIAYYLGAGQCAAGQYRSHARHAVSVLHGVAATVLGIAAMPSFLRLFTADETVIGLGVRYARIAFAFGVIIMLGLGV